MRIKLSALCLAAAALLPTAASASGASGIIVTVKSTIRSNYETKFTANLDNGLSITLNAGTGASVEDKKDLRDLKDLLMEAFRSYTPVDVYNNSGSITDVKPGHSVDAYNFH